MVPLATPEIMQSIPVPPNAVNDANIGASVYDVPSSMPLNEPLSVPLVDPQPKQLITASAVNVPRDRVASSTVPRTFATASPIVWSTCWTVWFGSPGGGTATVCVDPLYSTTAMTPSPWVMTTPGTGTDVGPTHSSNT